MQNKFYIGEQVYYFDRETNDIKEFIIESILYEPELLGEVLIYGDAYHNAPEYQITRNKDLAIDMEIDRLKKLKEQHESS